MENVILNTTYLGPIQFYTKLMLFKTVFIEQFDSYQKQSYRNRCRILGANGVLDLTIPVVKNSGKKTLVKDVRIDYATRWQNNHWRSIFSAYNSSPFFEYYESDLAPFYEKRYQFLIDFNMELHQMVAEALELETSVQLTTDYLPVFNGADFRGAITPKQNKAKPDPVFFAFPYTQTFSEKFGFVPNLSIIDLLFNAGPEAEMVLEKCVN